MKIKPRGQGPPRQRVGSQEFDSLCIKPCTFSRRRTQAGSVCARISGFSMPAAAVSHTTPKNQEGHGSHNSSDVQSSVFKLVGCITTVMAVSQQPQHGTAAWVPWLSSCCGTLSGLAPQPHRRHLSVPPSSTRGDRCPVQHGTVRPNLSRQQLATTGQTWRALRLLPSSNVCTIWSLP